MTCNHYNCTRKATHGKLCKPHRLYERTRVRRYRARMRSDELAARRTRVGWTLQHWEVFLRELTHARWVS